MLLTCPRERQSKPEMFERKQKVAADRPLRSRVLLLLLAVLMSFMQVLPAWSQPTAQGAGGEEPSVSINWQICPPQPLCFHSVEARQAWAKEHNCRFLEDVCEKNTPDKDNQGATEADKGFWGDLWDKVSGALTYGYEFVKGLFAGLKDQIGDLIDLISNPLEVAEGLIELGKAFYDDPKGTLATLAELLGQEAVDTITKATQCGAYDLGKVIGQYVSPAVLLKLATRLTHYGGKLKDAVKATKHDLGCASFVAGTPIHTGQGTQAIESIQIGMRVNARDEWRWSETPQRVDNTFKRTAPGYRELRTEFETYRVTDEHPLWVQGKGWTEAQHVTDEDVLGSLEGDVLVRENRAVAEPVEVYNFSVANTPNYFVGEAGLWVHNAKCDLPAKYMTFDRRQLQHEFKHAKDFGVLGNQNNQTLADFEKAIVDHVSSPNTRVIPGTYRGKPAVHYVDPDTGLNVFRDSLGNFWGAWKLSSGQLENVVSRGAL